MKSDSQKNETNWQSFSRNFQYYSSVGVGLDYSRAKLPNNFLDRYKKSAEDMFFEMAELERGKVANPDEGRMVGHYWLRTSELAPNAAIALEIDLQQKAVREFSASVLGGIQQTPEGEEFSHAVLLGIGGSALGPQLLIDALAPMSGGLQMSFCDNTDPDGIARILSNLGDNLRTTLFIVASKSGGTIETRNALLEVASWCQARAIEFAPRAVAITCFGSKLDSQSKGEGWLKQFYIWDWVGGRTSIFSAVGLLPAELAGIDTASLLKGASRMDELTRVADLEKNPAAILAIAWHWLGNGRGAKDMVLLPYKDRLILFSRYLQQLVMESLGKEKNRQGKVVEQGLSVFGNKGSTDQHAYVQQLRDGIDNFFVTFIRVLSDYTGDACNETPCEVEPNVFSGDYLNGFLLGTRQALSAKGRSSLTISLDTLSPLSLGAMIAMYERTVGFYASLVDINAYDQPGVEAGKKAASEVIDIHRKLVALLSEQSPGALAINAQDAALSIGAPEDAETVFHILSYLAANEYRGIVQEGETHPDKARFRRALNV